MATRARIGIKQKSGRIIASYQHWDGYPGGLGYNLCENWENSKTVSYTHLTLPTKRIV